MRNKWVLICGVMLATVSAAAAQPPDVTGSDVLANTMKAYAKLSRYVGTSASISRSVVQLNATQTFDGVSIANYKIEFVRDEKIKIEGLGLYEKRYSLIGDGKTATLTRTTWDDKEEIKKDLKLEEAVRRITAGTDGSKPAIAAALLGVRVYSPLDTLHAPELQGVEKIGIWDCHKVVDFDPVRNIRNTFWIDRKSFLVRQYQTEQGEMNLEGAYPDRPEIRKMLEETQQYMKKAGMKQTVVLHLIGIEQAR